MNYSFLCCFIAIAIIATAEGQGGKQCGMTQCTQDQYCVDNIPFYSFCRNYMQNGETCGRFILKCAPSLECKFNGYLGTCRPASSTTGRTSSTSTILPPTATA